MPSPFFNPGKQTVVLSGATGGVGRAVADRFARAGCTLFLVGRDAARLKDTIAAAGWNPARTYGMPADLADSAAVTGLADAVAQKTRELHVLVHCAGVHVSGTVEAGRIADFDEQFQVNLRGPFALTQTLLPLLRRSSGQIVFVNSSAGIMPRAGTAQYAATKHGLRALAGSLRDEVNPLGIRVLSLFLGRTASPMQAALHQEEQRPYRPERLLQPDDIATIMMAALALPRTAEVTDIHIRPMLKS